MNLWKICSISVLMLISFTLKSIGETPALIHIGIEKGLSNNNVTKIYKDKSGFVWIGTFDGLNRYDSYKFKTFKNQPGQESSLQDNRITDIIEDECHRIWVASKRGLAMLNKDQSSFTRTQFQQHSEKPHYSAVNFSINQLAFSSTAGLFAASSANGLLHIDKQGEDSYAERVGLRSKDGSILFDYNAQGVISSANGDLWVFVFDQGICKYDPKDSVLKIKNTQLKNISHFELDGESQTVWMGVHRTVYSYHLTDNVYSPIKDNRALENGEITVIYPHHEKVYIGTEDLGISVLNTKTQQLSQLSGAQSGFSRLPIHSLFIDDEERIWAGTLRGGIRLYDPHRGRFTHVQPEKKNNESNARNFISSFAEADDNTLWIGTDGGGIMQWDRSKNTFKSFVAENNTLGKLNNNFITGILRDQQGYIWASTYGGGISRLDPTTGIFKHYPCIHPGNNYDYNVTWKLFMDRQGNIWVSTLNGGGIFVYHEKLDRFVPKADDISDALSIFQESESVFWYGSWATLTRVDFHTGDRKTFATKAPVRDITDWGENDLLLATEGEGLLRMNKKTASMIRYTEQQGLPSNTILRAIKDQNNIVWLSTYNGISKFNPKDQTFINYYDSDGLQSNQFNYNAGLKLSSGEILFGGIQGFNIFFSDSVTILQNHPALVLTGMTINQQKDIGQYTENNYSSLNSITKLRIPYGEAALSVDFAAVDYSFPTKIRYAYILDDWEKRWNYTTDNRSATYTNLREGTYTLRIKSTNADGIWNEQEKTIQVTILPPWWRSIWAYFSYLLIAIAATAGYIRYDRQRNKLKYEIDLAKVNAEKEKELQEKKLSFFTHIAHEFRNPLTLITNPLKEMVTQQERYIERSDLNQIYNNSRRLLSLVDKLLLFRKTESGLDDLRIARVDIVQLTHEVFLCFKQQAELQHLNYTFHSTIANLEILLDREKIEICLFNLISNAMKYTPSGGDVHVGLLANGSTQCCIQIRDSGCGVATDASNKIFDVFQRDYSSSTPQKSGFGIGLFLVKSFVEAHHGEISHRPNMPKGTIFEVQLPTGEAHVNGHTIFEDVRESALFIEDVLDGVADRRASTDTAPAISAANISPLHQHIDSSPLVEDIVSDKKTMVIVDDNDEIRQYLRRMFSARFVIHEAASGEEGFELIEQCTPDIVISDIVMQQMSGIDLCAKMKQSIHLSHIPIILLTASSSQDVRLKGLEGGADDYITKPFDKDILTARVKNLIDSRNQIQQYFYNEITLQNNDFKISSEHKDFMEKSIRIVENHLDDPDFNVKILADTIGMSHSNFYKRLKTISGKTANEFIRFVRLRKVAKLLIETDCNINEAAFSAGFNDIKYFRTQFAKVFGMNPSAFKKKYQNLDKKHQLNIL